METHSSIETGIQAISWLDPGWETEKPPSRYFTNFEDIYLKLIFSYVWDGAVHWHISKKNEVEQLCKYEDVTLTIRHQDCYTNIDLVCGFIDCSLRIFLDISGWCLFEIIYCHGLKPPIGDALHKQDRSGYDTFHSFDKTCVIWWGQTKKTLGRHQPIKKYRNWTCKLGDVTC